MVGKYIPDVVHNIPILYVHTNNSHYIPVHHHLLFWDFIKIPSYSNSSQYYPLVVNMYSFIYCWDSIKPIDPSIYPPFYLFVGLFVYPNMYLSIYRSIYLYIYLI